MFKMIVSSSILILILTQFVTSENCECGIEGLATRVYRGQNVRPHKYPWLAHIRQLVSVSSDQIAYLTCGGSLIDNQHIITASHCVRDLNDRTVSPTRFEVYLGLVESNTNRSGLRVSGVYVANDYDRQTLENDFAILKLASPVTFNGIVSPICLPTSEDGVDKMTVAGWGRTISTSNTSRYLLEGQVELVPKDKCDDLQRATILSRNRIPRILWPYYRLPEVPDTLLCAINTQTYTSACEGDSGGPLMYLNPNNGRWYLIAVVSGAWDVCENKAPGLYTRILPYSKSIASAIPGACWKEF